MSSFKGNEDWLQTSILYEILPLNRVMELYIFYTQIRKIHRYETFVNMFVFSLNRLTPSRGEGVWLFTTLLHKYTCCIFIPSKTTLGQINLACFFGVNKICLTSNCAKFPFKWTILSVLIHFFGVIKHKYVWQVFLPKCHLNLHSCMYVYIFTFHQ